MTHGFGDGDSDNVNEFSAKLSADGKRCVITIRYRDGVVAGFDAVTANVRLTREQTFQLGQTLMLMTGSMRDGQ